MGREQYKFLTVQFWPHRQSEVTSVHLAKGAQIVRSQFPHPSLSLLLRQGPPTVSLLSLHAAAGIGKRGGPLFLVLPPEASGSPWVTQMVLRVGSEPIPVASQWNIVNGWELGTSGALGSGNGALLSQPPWTQMGDGSFPPGKLGWCSQKREKMVGRQNQTKQKNKLFEIKNSFINYDMSLGREPLIRPHRNSCVSLWARAGFGLTRGKLS